MSKVLSEDVLAELRAKYTSQPGEEAAVIIALLDEIDELDDALNASEDEVDQLRAKVEPQAVSGSVLRTPNGKWRVRWRKDGKQYSQTFKLRAHAEAFLVNAKRRGFGGVR